MKKTLIAIVSIITLSNCNTKTDKTETLKTIKDSVYAIRIAEKFPERMNEEGLNTDYYDNGKKRIKGEIKNGLRMGLWQAWYENGNLWSECEYTDGKKNGKSVTYYENGLVRYSGFCKNDKDTGEWSYFDEKGNLVKSVKK